MASHPYISGPGNITGMVQHLINRVSVNESDPFDSNSPTEKLPTLFKDSLCLSPQNQTQKIN